MTPDISKVLTRVIVGKAVEGGVGDESG